jgi:outer membrane lipoprotein carrier protein
MGCKMQDAGCKIHERNKRHRVSHCRLPTTDYPLPTIHYRLPTTHYRLSTIDYRLATAYCLLFLLNTAYALDVETVVAGLQRRYASVSTITGNFRQTYRAPGVDQIESGVFWLKKPGLMRWEYRNPEEKLFVANGKETFLFVPQDHQVTVQSFTASDMHNTPLEFLLGAGNISQSFSVAWETDYKSKAESALLIRMTPRSSEAAYSFLVLELDRVTYDLQRIVIHEPSGNTSEFLFANLMTNAKVDNRQFQFKIPKGAEVIRMTNDE